MGLAGSGRTEEQQRVAMRHPTAGREFAELALVERGLGAPVEPLEVAHERELRDLRGHLDAPMVASGDLPGHQERECLAQGHLRSRRLVEQARSEEHTSELQSLMRTSYAVFCLQKKTTHNLAQHTTCPNRNTQRPASL